MLPLWAIIMVAAAILTIIGIILAMTIERRRHRQLLQTQGLTRGLSTYHRPKLSANERNYSHVTPPITQLRRSVQSPYGIVSFASDSTIGKNEEKQSDASGGCLDDYIEVLRPSSKRRMRRSFNGQPLYIPKTRRPGKLRKSIPLDQQQKSPLSAITEFSDPPTSAPPDLSEFPAHSTTSLLPGRVALPPRMHSSTHWPLLPADSRGSRVIPTKITEVAARESVLLRKGRAVPTRGLATLLGPVPNFSEASLGPTAPGEPLPPLPTSNAHKMVVSHNLANRNSNASLDTVGSSVLGAYMNSPTIDRSMKSASKLPMGRPSPAIDLTLKQEFATPQLQQAAFKKTIHGLVSGKSIHSLHPSVFIDEPSPTKSRPNVPALPTITLRGDDSFRIIDASTWKLPPVKVDKFRGQSNQSHRHSMIEPSKLAQLRAVSDPATGLLADDDVFAIGAALQRPRSVATGNSLRWDRHLHPLSKRHSLPSMDGHKRGHRRQNCMRITNLPVLEKKSSIQRLPGLTEEQQAPGSVEKLTKTFEIMQPRPVYKPRAPVMDLKMSPSPSPFKNAPILTPTARPARKQYIQPLTLGSGLKRPSGTSWQDSEVFDSSQTDIPLSSPYSHTPGHWPLSLTAQTGVEDTPPSLRPTPFGSPILPSPALNSAFLYPRKSQVKGPRSPRISVQNSHPTTTSPLQNKYGHSYRVTKDRDSKGQNESPLAKSIAMLRSMNSEARLFEQQSSQPTVTMDADISPEISDLPTPPMNKRIMGLRTSSFSPSISAAPSPTLEKQQSQISRGPSPLASTSPSNLSVPYRAGAGNLSPTPKLSPNIMGLERSATSHLSISPSVRVPSMMSTGGASIWEDMSVRAESPDLDTFVEDHFDGIQDENRHLGSRTSGKLDQASRYLSPYPSRSTSQSTRPPLRQYTFPSAATQYLDAATSPALTEDEPENDIENENDHISPLVQRIERAASSSEWTHTLKSQSPKSTNDIQMQTFNPAQKHKHKQSLTTRGFNASTPSISPPKERPSLRNDHQSEPVTPRTKRDMDVFGGVGLMGNPPVQPMFNKMVASKSKSKKEAGVGLGLGLGLGLRLDGLIVGNNYTSSR